MRVLSAGTMVVATINDVSIAADKVYISSLKSKPTNPPMNKKGKIAAKLVLVDATIALVISAAASVAALTLSFISF